MPLFLAYKTNLKDIKVQKSTWMHNQPSTFELPDCLQSVTIIAISFKSVMLCHELLLKASYFYLSVSAITTLVNGLQIRSNQNHLI